MSTIQDTIAWLRRLRDVSCPEITCQQAAEVAEMLEEVQRWNRLWRRKAKSLHAEAEALKWKGVAAAWWQDRDDAEKERDALKAEVERLTKPPCPDCAARGAPCWECEPVIKPQRRRGDK